jgi:hypothetical protein
LSGWWCPTYPWSVPLFAFFSVCSLTWWFP